TRPCQIGVLEVALGAQMHHGFILVGAKVRGELFLCLFILVQLGERQSQAEVRVIELRALVQGSLKFGATVGEALFFLISDPLPLQGGGDEVMRPGFCRGSAGQSQHVASGLFGVLIITDPYCEKVSVAEALRALTAVLAVGLEEVTDGRRVVAMALPLDSRLPSLVRLWIRGLARLGARRGIICSERGSTRRHEKHEDAN